MNTNYKIDKLVRRKIDDCFSNGIEEYNLKTGDICPMDSNTLDDAIEDIVSVIDKFIEKNK